MDDEIIFFSLFRDQERRQRKLLMQNQDLEGPSPGRRHKDKTPIKDEFTEFSQYGSRFMLNQMEEKKKEKNFVEQIQENKIFKKVASTCQKHYHRKTSNAAADHLNVSDHDTTVRSPTSDGTGASVDRKVQMMRESSHVSLKDTDTCPATCPAPAAMPRSKKLSVTKQNIPNTGEPDKFDPIQLERKTAMLFKKAEQSDPSHHSVSMNTDPRACWGSR